MLDFLTQNVNQRLGRFFSRLVCFHRLLPSTKVRVLEINGRNLINAAANLSDFQNAIFFFLRKEGGKLLERSFLYFEFFSVWY